MFDVVLQAELRPCELSKLLGVHRITASHWLKEYAKPHPLLAGRVQSFVDVVRQCVDNGDLPLPLHVSRRERGFLIRKALTAHGWEGTTD